MHVLVLNTGSSSVKFEVFAVDDWDASPTSVLAGDVTGIGEPAGGWSVGPDVDEARTIVDHDAALTLVMDELDRRGMLAGLVAIGHRVVHGGEAFTEPTLVDDDVVGVLEDLAPLAPLHNPPALRGIEVARRLAPDVPHVAVFDTAFHQSMAPAAYRYAVPGSWYRDHGVRRFGFHGTSHRYVYEQAAAALGRSTTDCRAITLHLGNGASATAIDGGRVVDTSMGMSPLEGLVMGTRSGTIDPGIVFHMVREGMDVAEVERVLNRESGLLGLAGANDVRRVEAAAADGDRDARIALEVMAHRLRAVVGAYLANLGGLDVLVFTAGIGQHDAAVRARVVEPLAHLGLRLDGPANESADASTGPARISPAGVEPTILVVATAEELVIARDALAVARDEGHAAG